jgi:hypothetical protein
MFEKTSTNFVCSVISLTFISRRKHSIYSDPNWLIVNLSVFSSDLQQKQNVASRFGTGCKSQQLTTLVLLSSYHINIFPQILKEISCKPLSPDLRFDKPWTLSIDLS